MVALLWFAWQLQRIHQTYRFFKVGEITETSLHQPYPALYKEWIIYSRQIESVTKFLKYSGRFPLTATGELNTYAFFAEQSYEIVGSGGRIGIVIPSGIATDNSSRLFFDQIVERGSLISLFDFENRLGIFSGVHRMYKFSLVTMGKLESLITENPIDFVFYATNISSLENSDIHFSLSYDDIKLLNPNTRNCPIFRNKFDANIVSRIYQKIPIIDNENFPENGWKPKVTFVFEMNKHSHLFKDGKVVRQGTRKGFHVFEFDNKEWISLYEAKQIYMFDHRYATYEQVQGKDKTRYVSLSESSNPNFTVDPRQYVGSDEFTSSIKKRGFLGRKWFITYRDITNASNERTSIFSIIPFVPMGNTWTLLLIDASTQKVCCFLANMNSFTHDFITRTKVGGSHLNFYILRQLPAISSSHYSPKLEQFVIPKVLELISTAWDIQSFADDVWSEADENLRAAILQQWEENAATANGGHTGVQRPEWVGTPDPDGFPHPPFKWDEERRLHLRAELDGLYAHLYGLTRDEFAYILDTFPIVRRKDEAKYGEFRTKRLCLEAYDRLIGSDLIPPEARALQQESVIGEKATIPVGKPAARQPEAKVSPSVVPPSVKPALADPPSEPQRPAASEKAAEAASTVAPASPTAPVAEQLTLTDYSLYRCAECDKRVLGFDRMKHVREAHGGIDPGWKKL